MTCDTACRDSAEEIRRQISEGAHVSAQPSALPDLLRALDDDEIDVGKLAEVVERFPDIAARLVSLANSAWCTPVEPITQVERACAQLGLGLVRSVSLSLSIMAPFDVTRCVNFESNRFWGHTFLVADCAESLAARTEVGRSLRPETARACGLFHNLGLLWLVDKQPEMTASAIARADDDSIGLNDSLRSLCGMDASDVGGLLGRAWELPDVFIAAMEHNGTTDCDGTGRQAAAVVRAAMSVVRTVVHDDRLQDCQSELERLGLDANDRGDFMEAASAKLTDTVELARTLKL